MTTLITGEFTKVGENYEGVIAGLDFHYMVTLVPNTTVSKTDKEVPEFQIEGVSPGGYPLQLGGVWRKTSEAKKEYLSISLKGRTPIYCNASPSKKGDWDHLRVYEYAQKKKAA